MSEAVPPAAAPTPAAAPIPPPATASAFGASGPSRRSATVARTINIAGTAATVSAFASFVMAGAAGFTALQAYNVSQRVAREQVFGRQLQACTDLGSISSELQGRNRRVLRLMARSGIPATEPQMNAVEQALQEREDSGVRLVSTLAAADVLFGEVTPTDDLQAIVVAESQYASAQVGLADDQNFSPDEMIALRDAQAREAVLINAQRMRCTDYLRRVVRGGGEVR